MSVLTLHLKSGESVTHASKIASEGGISLCRMVSGVRLPVWDNDGAPHAFRKEVLAPNWLLLHLLLLTMVDDSFGSVDSCLDTNHHQCLCVKSCCAIHSVFKPFGTVLRMSRK